MSRSWRTVEKAAGRLGFAVALVHRLPGKRVLVSVKRNQMMHPDTGRAQPFRAPQVG